MGKKTPERMETPLPGEFERTVRKEVGEILDNNEYEPEKTRISSIVLLVIGLALLGLGVFYAVP